MAPRLFVSPAGGLLTDPHVLDEYLCKRIPLCDLSLKPSKLQHLKKITPSHEGPST